MAYNHNYFEDTSLFASNIDAALDAVALALNTIDEADLPDQALDTQHFSENWVLKYANTVEYSAGFTTVDEALHTVSTWPPAYAEWKPSNALSFSGANAWDQSGDYQALEIWANAQLAYVQAPGTSTRFAMGIAVFQAGAWVVVPKTVRLYSIPDHQVNAAGLIYADIPIHTVLMDGDLASAADVEGARIVWGIRAGGGSTLCYVTSYNITVLQKRTGDLGV